ncbi:lysozyme [Dyella marensis]|uniref:lysozyme n=1 Tax=Dyella marensis TaxID=500610 RepID=UPI0031D26F04
MEAEGERLTAYKDVAGIWTIGVGHAGLEVKPGMTISRVESRRLLAQDVQSVAQAVASGIDVPLGGPQFDALVALVFNIGSGNFRTSTVRRVINELKFDAVPAAWRLWNKVTIDGQKLVSQGLANRREAELLLWNSVV